MKKLLQIFGLFIIVLAQPAAAQTLTVGFDLTNGMTSLQVPKQGETSNVTFSITLTKAASATISGDLKIYLSGSEVELFRATGINDNYFTGIHIFRRARSISGRRTLIAPVLARFMHNSKTLV